MIKPVNDFNMSYSMIMRSPLDISLKEVQNFEITPSRSFFESIKQPKLDPLDLYNKCVIDLLRYKKHDEIIKQKIL